MTKANVMVAAVFLLSLFGAVGADNLLLNPDFELGQTPWIFGPTAGGMSTTESIVTEGCRTGFCLKLTTAISNDPGDLTFKQAFASQEIPAAFVPGKTYALSAWVKTSTGSSARLAFYDLDWKKKEGNTCVKRGKLLYKTFKGTGAWTLNTMTSEIPTNDDCNEPTSSHKWRAYLYAVAPNDGAAVLYDDVKMEEFVNTGEFVNLEEKPGWDITCKIINGSKPIECNANAVSFNTDGFTKGSKSMVLKGDKNTEMKLKYEIPTTPGTLYEVNIKTKFLNRTCYDFSSLGYPAGYVPTTQSVKIWCGAFSAKLNAVNASLRLTQPVAYTYNFISNSETDWFDNGELKQTYKVRPNTNTLTFELALKGFVGEVRVDGIELKKISNVVSDWNFQYPVMNEYAGMRVSATGGKNTIVATSSAHFEFSQDAMIMSKQGARVGEITGHSGFFSQLSVDSTSVHGAVILENENVKIRMNGDSSFLVRLKKKATLTVSGPKPTYWNMAAGSLFETDFTKGLLFSPVYDSNAVDSMPLITDDARNYYYNETRLATLGYNVGKVEQSPTNANGFRVSYTFSEDGAFTGGVFPPKEFDKVKYCTERAATIPEGFKVISAFPNYARTDDAIKYLLQSFSERSNIPIIWSTAYLKSENNQKIPEGAPAPLDIQGEYGIQYPQLMKKYTDTAHAMGMKVIAYTTPEFYYTRDPSAFFANLEELRAISGLDGFYFDGLYEHDALRNAYFVRKARDVIGKGFIMQHNSLTDFFTVKRTIAQRVPWFDAYADRLLVGEHVKLSDPLLWKVNFCGQNVGNTPSEAMSEWRPVDYSQDESFNRGITLSGEAQWQRSIACWGLFRQNNVPPKESTIIDQKFGAWKEYDSKKYVETLNELCLPITCGNKVCDIGESTLSCAKDCAPVKTELMLKKNGDKATCDTQSTNSRMQSSVAQWIVNAKPLFKLHFTFDGSIVSDDSGNKLNPTWIVINATPIDPPRKQVVDGRKTFLFGGVSALYKDYNGELGFKTSPTAKDSFTVLAAFKRADAKASAQKIFSLGTKGFSLGIENSKIVFKANAGNKQRTFTSKGMVNGDKWHSVAVVYSKGLLTTYIDGVKDSANSVELDPQPVAGRYSIGNNTGGFNGWMDDFALSETAFTPTQITQYHANQLKQFTASGISSCIALVDGKYYSPKK